MDYILIQLFKQPTYMFVGSSCLCLTVCDPGYPQWTGCGTSGPAGAPARPPALMGPCRGPGSVTAPRTAAPSAEESGWRLSTASSGSAQV